MGFSKAVQMVTLYFFLPMGVIVWIIYFWKRRGK